MNNNKPFKPPRRLGTARYSSPVACVNADSRTGSFSSPLSSTTGLARPRIASVDANVIPDNPNETNNIKIKYYVILFRKYTSKKNKSWDGDGFLCSRTVQETLNFHLILKNENYENLASGLKKKVDFNNIVSLGSFEFEVDYEITDELQLLQVGKCFANSNTNSANSRLKANNSLSRKKQKVNEYKQEIFNEKCLLDDPKEIGFNKTLLLSKPFKCVMKPSNSFPTTQSDNKIKKITDSKSSHIYKPLFPIKEDSIIMDRLPNAVVDVIIDPSLSRHMRAHQSAGVKFLYNCVMGSKILNDEGLNSRGALLADDMGLGKTLTSIALIWTLLKQSPFRETISGWKQDENKGRNPTYLKSGLSHKSLTRCGVLRKVLIVVPLTLINNWQEEFKKWLGMNYFQVITVTADSPSNVVSSFMHSRIHTIMIIGYERLISIFNNDSVFKYIKFDMVVCDEAHRMKNENAKSVKVLKKLKVEKVVLLTGTPVQNDSKEFFTLCDISNPGVFGKYTDFMKGNGISRTQMIDISKNFILRRTKDILLKVLPSRHDLVVFIKPLKNQLRLFKAVKPYLKDNFDNDIEDEKYDESMENDLNLSMMKKDVLSLINIYKKICNSPKLLNNDSFFKRMFSDACKFDNIKDCLSENSGKLNFLMKFLENLHGKTKEKVVIISNYTQTLDIIERMVGCKYALIRLDGKVNAQKRMKLVDEFNKNNGIFIFLLSSKSGGAGLNLVGASRLIMFDGDWNPAVDIQAMGRIHRDGQKMPCFIYRLITTGCIDEKIYQRQLVKIALSNCILGETSKANEKDQIQEMFSEEELKDLFTVDSETKCNTYDLISSKTGDEDEDEMEDDKDDEEKTKSRGKNRWITANQYKDLQSETESRLRKERKRRLGEMLEHFRHVDPDEIGGFAGVQDEILRSSAEAGVSFLFCKG